MTEIFQYNSVVNKKPKKNILNHLKHYLSNSLVHHHHHHHEKPPKSIECRQTTITNSNEVLHSKMITSSKLLTNQCHTNSWTIKQFKKRLKLLHNNKFKQKSTTLCIEPSKVIQSIDSYELHQHYHTMKESLNEKHHMNTSIDNISLQLSSMHSSLSLNECNNIEEENKMYHTKITNLDEDELDKIIPNESINTLDYINTILNESNIDHTLYDYHHDHDHQQHHLQHYQQQHQQHHHRYPHQRQYKQQYDKYSLNQLTSFNNQLLSTSDIYSIFTSYDKLNDYSNLSLNKSIINNQSSFSLNKSIINNSINQTNLITTTTTLNKVNAINKTNQLIKKYFHLSNKLKTLSSMIDINKRPPPP
ncbi:hypothetical protein MN116_002564 [Schistosoma mekongi]|uniref:Uncharacterized protein n=1 Tax=Schistosoma mekongi TaxID=38744 RepID=A0AAE1ZKF4_SCHME|nr:hypothetical protein MN116_002564 [Schistosoma mekongi]